jgi:hypothetical protein
MKQLNISGSSRTAGKTITKNSLMKAANLFGAILLWLGMRRQFFGIYDLDLGIERTLCG